MVLDKENTKAVDDAIDESLMQPKHFEREFCELHCNRLKMAIRGKLHIDREQYKTRPVVSYNFVKEGECTYPGCRDSASVVLIISGGERVDGQPIEIAVQ
jgi:hypothetical protein